VLEQIATSLHAAAVSEQGRQVLADGRFTQAMTLEGFNALAGLAPPSSKRPTKPKPSRGTEEMKQLRAGLVEARKQLRNAERAARDARRLAAQADLAVETATKSVRDAEERLRR
jgi:hypothetical protein